MVKEYFIAAESSKKGEKRGRINSSHHVPSLLDLIYNGKRSYNIVFGLKFCKDSEFGSKLAI